MVAPGAGAQLLGLEVNAINSVQFSNHGGYPTVRGLRLDGGDLTDLADGLDANGLLCENDYLLTGSPPPPQIFPPRSARPHVPILIRRLPRLCAPCSTCCPPYKCVELSGKACRLVDSKASVLWNRVG